jgi:hypothetical protein
VTTVEARKYEELLKAHKDEAKAEWYWLRWKCLTDLYWLGTEVLGLAKEKKRVYPRFHRWLCQQLSLEDNKMILVPRKHAKTTWVKVRIVQEILQSAGAIRILFLARTERLVIYSLASIKRFLSNELLRKLFPEVLVDPGKDYKNWVKSTTNELVIKENPEAVSNEPQIMALGSAAAFTGTAVDRIYLDDYIDEETCRSASKMDKAVEDWRYLQPLLDAGATICITGTFYHYNDLYNMIIREKHFPRNRVFVRKAVENGKILYPTMFNQKKLDNLKRILGPYIFSCQYMLDPIPREDQIFPGPQPTCTTLPKDKYRYYIMVDPAATVSGTSDKTAVVVAAINSQKHIYYVEAVSFKKHSLEKALYIIQKCIQYRPERVGIEYGLQKDLDYILKSQKSDYEASNRVRVPMNIYPITINNKQSKGDRIYLTLGTFVRDHKVMILESGCRELIRQMDHFTGKGREEDDVVDAASLLFPLVGEFGYPSSMIDRINPERNSFFDVFKKRVDNSWRSNFVA